jgi:hypothetical protein
MDDFATWASIIAIGVHITSLIKYASAGDGRSVVTAIIPMAALFVVLLLAGEADATAGVVVPGLDTPLGDLDVASLLLVALAGGSLGSQVLYNGRKAIDNGDSAEEPKLGETSFIDHGH